jgi:hypothetical protein
MESEKRTDFSICRISAMHEYILRLINSQKDDRLTTTEKKIGQIITMTGVDELCDHFIKVIESSTIKHRILKFIKKGMLQNTITLMKFCTILNSAVHEVFTEDEIVSMVQCIYECIEHIKLVENTDFKYDTILNICPKFDITMRLKKIEINNKLFKNDNLNANIQNDIVLLVNNTLDPNEKNMILNFIFNKEINSIKKPQNKKSYYSTNSEHYNRMVTYAKLICTNGKSDIIKETLKTYVNLLVTGNILCDTVSANLSDTISKKTTKALYRTMLHFLMLTTDKYMEIFVLYKSLIKLKYIDCDIGTNIGMVDKHFLLDLDIDNILNEFEYFSEIKRVTDYLMTVI